MTPDELEERLVRFAIRIGRIVDALPETRMGRHVSGQLIRCGTSIAPNYAEGCAAESRNDFIHKLAICLKEIRETRVWLKMIADGGLLKAARLTEVLREIEELRLIFASSLKTSKEKRRTAAVRKVASRKND